MRKILVTGAGGYIGRHVVDYLVNSDIDVVACDFNTTDVNQRATCINMDIFSGDNDIFQKLGSPNVCIHMAWKDGFIHNSDSHMLYLSKHYEFLNNLITAGIEQLVVMGTMHEIGYWEGPIDELTPSNPTSMYGIAKDALRRSMFEKTKSSSTILQWLRAYYIYGDDSKNNSIFAKIVRTHQEGKTTFPFTTGKNKYDFIDVEVLAKMIAQTALQTKITGVINCSTGIPISLADKVEEFIKDHHFNIKLQYGAFPDRPYDSPGVWGDATKINQILNLY